MIDGVPPIGAFAAYRQRWRRRGFLWRSFQSRHQLRALTDRTDQIAAGDILAVTTLRNEAQRLPWFLEHYRALGADHFLMIDNDSDDGSAELLSKQSDVSLWQTDHSYRGARFGLDWLTWLQMRYAHDHWCLMVDADELLIYDHHDTRQLQDLTRWLSSQGRKAFGALMLDLYPKGPLGHQHYEPGDDPTELLQWYDAGPYRKCRQQPLGNLWVQGGARERVFFADEPRRSPTLNKIPLVHWSRRYACVNSCHAILPRPLNFAYDGPGSKEPSGVLLHTKFLPHIVSRAGIEKERGQHFNKPEAFENYYDAIIAGPDMWSADSERFDGWQKLVAQGLMHSAGW